MFTGIIQNLGKITRAEKAQASLRLMIDTGFDDLALGESVAVNGVCLTVAELASHQALFFLSQETLDRSSLGNLKENDRVNLERALRAADRLSGHIVQGHVDATASLSSIRSLGESHEVSFLLPKDLAKFCVEKGSIAIDGVSLTINKIVEKSSENFEIQIVLIPHTWTHTRFSTQKVGESVNIEVDVLAKYVANHLNRGKE